MGSGSPGVRAGTPGWRHNDSVTAPAVVKNNLCKPTLPELSLGEQTPPQGQKTNTGRDSRDRAAALAPVFVKQSRGIAPFRTSPPQLRSQSMIVCNLAGPPPAPKHLINLEAQRSGDEPEKNLHQFPHSRFP